MSYNTYDEKLARSINDQLNCTGITENAVIPKEKEKYRPRTLVDETLEYIDPTPNIHTLFIQFNAKFFWNVLLPVQVKWSPRMTSCAGICSFHPRNRECIIALSTPLLKLRPRKDLIETLLHEMIHAYLFLTNNNRDRDGHGPVFQSHMKRINQEAGTNITIYHSFHEEVRLYQQHWWRCNGPCQKRPPYFGTVRRAMNRAPGKNDFWWAEHQATCGGTFIKVKEPEKPEKNKGKGSRKSQTNITSTNNSLSNWMKKPTNNTGNVKDTSKNSTNVLVFNNTKINSNQNINTDMKKLGNATNNVHGWGTGGPTGTSNYKKNVTSNTPSSQPKLLFTGTLGGSSTGRSNLLDKYSSSSTASSSNSFKKSTPKASPLPTNNLQSKHVSCPSCSKSVEESKINEHLDICLISEPEIEPSTSGKKRKNEDEDYKTPNKVPKDSNQSLSKNLVCPLCSKPLKPDEFNNHLDICLQNDFDDKPDEVVCLNDSTSSSVNLQDSPHCCLICDKVLEPTMTLNEHLEECVASVFNDSNVDEKSFNDNYANDSIVSNSSLLEESKTEEEPAPLDSFPCPICMTLIKESLMNEHLDQCLEVSK